ncbi:MAG: hypothetical protein ACRBFS_19510 [Aureispira sp.]
MKTLLVTICMLVCCVLVAQEKSSKNSFSARVGVAYSPRFIINDIQDEGPRVERVSVSMLPTVDVELGDDKTMFRASLGGITRLGVLLGHKWGYVGFSYTYALDFPEETAHSAEIEIGARLKVGTESRYRVSLGLRSGTSIRDASFFVSPFIGVTTKINK